MRSSRRYSFIVRTVLILTFPLFPHFSSSGSAQRRSSGSSTKSVAVVTEPNAPVQSGTTILFRVRQGDRLPVMRRSGEWLRIRNGQGVSAREGWIHVGNAKVESDSKYVSPSRSSGKSSSSASTSRRIAKPTSRRSTLKPATKPTTKSITQSTTKPRKSASRKPDLPPTKERKLAMADYMLKQALPLLKEKSFFVARPMLSVALDNQLAAVGEKDKKSALILFHLGEAHAGLKQFKFSKNYHIRALNVRFELFGKDHLDTASSLHATGVILRELGEYDDSVKYLSTAFTIRNKLLGRHLEVAASFEETAKTAKLQKDHKNRLLHLKAALAINQQQRGVKHPEVARIFEEMADAAQDMGDASSAKQFRREAANIR